METFNIKIKYRQDEVVLTILKEVDHYLVIYYGGIFGAVCRTDKEWKVVSKEEILPGHLPSYEPGRPGERTEMEWSSNLAQLIGKEIELHHNGVR